MADIVRRTRAPNTSPHLDNETAALIKGMLLRGDKQSDIAACFGQNGGRIAEINKKQTFATVKAAAIGKLPPAGPYPSPFDLWKAGREMWRVRCALTSAGEKVEEALRVVRRVEQHGSVK